MPEHVGEGRDVAATLYPLPSEEVPEGVLTSSGLGDEKYYMLISEMLMQLCTAADTLPCMFDAAVFDSFDEEEWETEIPW